MNGERCRLYLITPSRLNAGAFKDTLARALDAGPVAAVQLRLKDVDDDTIRRAAEALRPVAHAREVDFLMNDRPDLAAETGCDGVHIGQEDAGYEEARRAVGAEGVVGVTCHDCRHLAMQAAESGADYVAFGAFFPTATKEAKTRARPDVLSWWSELTTVQCVAVGGITAANCGELVRAGADFLAVASGVWNHGGGPAEAVRAFNRVLDETAPD